MLLQICERGKSHLDHISLQQSQTDGTSVAGCATDMSSDALNGLTSKAIIRKGGLNLPYIPFVLLEIESTHVILEPQ